MKNKIIIFGILCLLICFYLVFRGTYSYNDDSYVTSSLENNIVIDCDKIKVSPSSEIHCVVKGVDFDSQVSSFSAKLSFGNNLSLKNVDIDNKLWQGSGDDGKIDLYTDVNKVGDFDIFSFDILVGSVNTGIDTNILLKDIVISDDNFDEIQIKDVLCDIRVASNIATLNSLTVEDVDFTFNPNIYSYNLKVDVDEVTINAKASNVYANVSGIGVKRLNNGKNVFDVEVVAEDDSKKIYMITIVKEDKLEFDDSVIVDDINKYLIFSDGEVNVSDITKKIFTTGSLEISNDSGNVLNSSDVVSTGNNLKINLFDSEKNYKIIVLGDVTGDGVISVTDVSKLFQYYRKKISMNKEYITAGDVIIDEEIRLTDVTKLFQYVRKTIASLK